jgi:hypothetical protein
LRARGLVGYDVAFTRRRSRVRITTGPYLFYTFTWNPGDDRIPEMHHRIFGCVIPLNAEVSNWADKKPKTRNTPAGENIVQSRRPEYSGWQTDCVQKEKVRLCVLHLGFCDESVFANVVHEALFLCNLFSTDFLLPAGLVVLHRGCPDISIFADKVEVALFALDLFFSNFGSHLNTSKPLLGFDNESYRLII